MKNRGREGCIARFVREADDLVLPLQPNERLAQVASLRRIRTEFESSDCLLLYGQHRLATGELGGFGPELTCRRSWSKLEPGTFLLPGPPRPPCRRWQRAT
jgi:hypothetical protein